MANITLILSVILGVLIIGLIKPKKEIIQFLISFSGAYLLAMTVTHLLPEVFSSDASIHEDHHHEHHHEVSTKIIGVFILFGVLLQSLLESFSKGAEHGHIHIHDQNKFPWMLFIALSIHAFSEGIPLGYIDDSKLLWAIVIHKLPVSIVLTSFFVKSSYSKFQIIGFMIAFAFMSPLGSILATNFHFFHENHAYITALIIGIFLHISTIILFESTDGHKFDYKKFVAIILGFGISLIG